MSPRIEDYALLGDLHSAALVGRNGSIDWLCLPRFDSPACFAALLDDHGGHWRIAPDGAATATRRRYDGETLTLETEWETADGTILVRDCMPPRGDRADIVRIVEGVCGRVPVSMDLRPRFDYGRITPAVARSDGATVVFAGPDALWLRSDAPAVLSDDGVTASVTIEAGERVAFVLTHQPSHLPAPSLIDPFAAVGAAARFWRGWIRRCTYRGRWSPAVRRALILLKALTYAPTGGTVAAASMALPEAIGGTRNWDYRYCWLRDATFTLQALLGTGYVTEAAAWRDWLVRAVAGDPADLQIMYAVDGARRVPESTLDQLQGFAGSTPVREGNAAAGQFQLDVWGEVLQGLHLAREAGIPPDDTAWATQRHLLDFLEGNWRRPDNGLWEIRGDRKHFVHSKVLAWAGFDRAVRAVERFDLPGPVDRWRRQRDAVHAEVCERGFDRDRGTFTQAYGTAGVDAALLLMPRVGFLPWSDPRVRGTVAAVRQELSVDGLLRRYRQDTGTEDGLTGSEGAFVACSFWLVDALHGIGRADEAAELFEQLLTLGNDVGMFSEEYDPSTHRQLGNTPQSFSLVGLVNAAGRISGEPTDTASP